MQVPGLFTVTAIIATAAAAVPSNDDRVPLEFRDALRASCFELAESDRNRLPTGIEDTSWGFHEQVRTAPFEPSNDADPLIKILLSHSGPRPSPERTIWAWKEADGRWRVSRAAEPDQMDSSAAAYPELDPDSIRLRGWSLEEGALSAFDAQALEFALRAKCFEDEPPVRAMTVPLRRGGELNCTWHPSGKVMEIAQGGNRRTFVRACSHYLGPDGARHIAWPSDLIADLLQRADLEGVRQRIAE